MKKLIFLFFVFTWAGILGTIDLVIARPAIALPGRGVREDVSGSFDKGKKNRPTYPGNSGMPAWKFISQERAIGKLPSHIKVLSVKLRKWGEYERERMRGERNEDIDLERMVWDVNLEYQNGIEFDSGRCKSKARVNKAVDAETGKLLGFEIRCPKGAFESTLPKPTPEQEAEINRQIEEMRRRGEIK